MASHSNLHLHIILTFHLISGTLQNDIFCPMFPLSYFQHLLCPFVEELIADRKFASILINVELRIRVMLN